MNKPAQTKVFIVDDNQSAIDVLRLKLEKNYAVDIVGTSNDSEDAINQIFKTEPDLLFLDIELPEITGLEFWEKIRNDLKPETKVVFYTGHDKYMLDAIRKQAFDYLLKPPTVEDLAQLMTRYYENKLQSMPTTIGMDSHQPLILVLNMMNEHVTLKLEDIAYFRYNQDRKMWEIICLNNEVYTLRHRTNADVILNYSSALVQIHKRFIVNINQIKMIKGAHCILNEPLNKISELHISKNYRPNLMNTFYSM